MKMTILDIMAADARDLIISSMKPAAERVKEIALSPDAPPHVSLNASLAILDRGGLSPQAALWREQQKAKENAVQLDFWGAALLKADTNLKLEDVIESKDDDDGN